MKNCTRPETDSASPLVTPLVNPHTEPPFPDPIPGVFRFGSIATLSGETGVGKNAMASEWIARWQSGRSICGHKTNRPAAIGMLAGDRGWHTAKQWLIVADCQPIHHVCIRDDYKFRWADLRDWRKVPPLFLTLLKELALPPGSLLIVDPLALFLPGRVNDYKDMAIALGTLDQIIKPFQLSTLGIFHQSKQFADTGKGYHRPQDRILGSAAQIGFSDTSMYLMSPTDLDTGYYGLGWVPHNAPAETFMFTRADNGLFVPYTGVMDESDVAEQDRPTALHELIPATTDGIDATELVELAIETLKVSRATVYRDLKTLRDRRLIKMAAGWIWKRQPS